MDILSLAIPLLLVIDPFGNLPFVLSVLGRLPAGRYMRSVSREMAIAALILTLFALLGQRLLIWLGISQAALHVAGGIVLFLIALKMIFSSAAELFHADEATAADPLVVPIAMPSIAGPSAVATVLFLAAREDVSQIALLAAIAVAIAVSLIIFLLGRLTSELLGPRGLNALEKLTGMLLSIIAVNMILEGIRMVFAN